MKIISKFKDYYDSMRCYAMCSDDFMYIRKIKEILVGNPRTDQFNSIDSRSSTFKYTIDTFIIGFCGKFYQGYIVTKPANPGIHTYTLEKRVGIYYSAKEAYSIAVDTKYVSKAYKKGVPGRHRWDTVTANKGNSVKETRLNIITSKDKMENEWFKKKVEQLTKANIFKEHNTPCFVYTHLTSDRHQTTNIIINPPLKDFEFFKIFEGHRCYQELEMYLGNKLLEKNNAPQIIDDKVKIQQHGFDLKKSFRKAPTKRRK